MQNFPDSQECLLEQELVIPITIYIQRLYLNKFRGSVTWATLRLNYMGDRLDIHLPIEQHFKFCIVTQSCHRSKKDCLVDDLFCFKLGDEAKLPIRLDHNTGYLLSHTTTFLRHEPFHALNKTFSYWFPCCGR